MNYHRVPLSSSEGIRLLRYSEKSTRERLVCRLESASTNDAYHALSYVWGNAEPSSLVRISCNGETVPVTANLFDALSQMWRQFPDRRIWADALCINQADHNERIAQVAMMGDIYRRCQSVMVWWGKYVLQAPFETHFPDSDIEELFVNFETWATRGETQWRCDPACTTGQLCAKLPPDQIHKDASRLRGPGRGLMQNEWLRRMWTMQEICVAPHASVHLGRQYLQWEAFLTGLTLYTEIMPQILARDWGTWDCLEFAQNFRRKGARGLNLSRILDGSQLRRATEPRDMIHALLGLLPSGVYPSLEKVSYHRPVASLYAEVSRLCWDVDNANNLPSRALWSRDRNDLDPEPPSWLLEVPSWSVDWSASRSYFPSSLVSTDEAGLWKFDPRSQSSATSLANMNKADEYKLRVFFVSFARLTKVEGDDGGLQCGDFPDCVTSLRRCIAKPATLQVRTITEGMELETIRLDSKDVSRMSEVPIEGIKMLKSIEHHESLECTCGHAITPKAKSRRITWPWKKTTAAKASAAAPSWGNSVRLNGRAGDWVGVLANKNGHAFQGLVLLRPEPSGCFRLIYCGGTSVHLLDITQKQVLEYGTSEVEMKRTLEYNLVTLDLI